MLHQRTLAHQMLLQRIQHHQHVTQGDIKRIVRRDYMWDSNEVTELLKLLDQVPQTFRVQAAVLKLGERNFKKLNSYVQMATVDSWSVVFFGEFPNFYHIENNTPEKREESITKDWFAYIDWLNKA